MTMLLACSKARGGGSHEPLQTGTDVEHCRGRVPNQYCLVSCMQCVCHQVPCEIWAWPAFFLQQATAPECDFNTSALLCPPGAHPPLAGEVSWVKRSVARHHAAAASKGVKVLHCCGYDSVPSDLGTYMMVAHCREQLGWWVQARLDTHSLT